MSSLPAMFAVPPAAKKKAVLFVMMVSKKESALIRSFVSEQLCCEPDLSTLTLGILRKRYLAHVECESLSPEAKKFMKLVVEEELTKIQENDKNGTEVETKKPQSKRKRGKENEDVESEGENESRAKKSRSNHSSSSESEDTEDHESGHKERIKSPSKDMKQETKNSEPKRPGNSKSRVTSDDSTDDEIEESEQKESGSECGDSPKETVKKKASSANKEKSRNSDTSGGKRTQESDKDDESDADSKSSRSDKIDDCESSDSEKEEKVLSEKKNNDTDSDSSSLPSLEEESDSRAKNVTKGKKKRKTGRTVKSTRGTKQDDDKAVVRLKRYIALCGVRRNYKKMLDGCKSVRSKVAVLKKELEDLGVHGNPSIEKCKKVRMKREEAKEVAELDVGNIITTQGRPKRRGTSARQEQHDPPSSAYQRTLNSGSDSDQENNSHRGRRKISEWSNLHGIISDDADSD